MTVSWSARCVQKRLPCLPVWFNHYVVDNNYHSKLVEGGNWEKRFRGYCISGFVSSYILLCTENALYLMLFLSTPVNAWPTMERTVHVITGCAKRRKGGGDPQFRSPRLVAVAGISSAFSVLTRLRPPAGALWIVWISGMSGNRNCTASAARSQERECIPLKDQLTNREPINSVSNEAPTFPPPSSGCLLTVDW